MIASIVLAAGSSSRMGQPKQILPLGSSTILEHVIANARQVSDLVYVVLGAAMDQIIEYIALDDDLRLVVNEHYQEGMASSIRTAISTMLLKEEIEATFLMLGDQPLITKEIGATMLHRWQNTHADAIIPRYGEQFGNPVLFARTAWQHLLQLQGDIGARQLIKQHIFAQVEECAFPVEWLPVDCDTPEEYANVLRANLEKDEVE